MIRYIMLLGALCAVASLANEVTDWNKIMLSATLTTPVTPAPVSTRVAAISRLLFSTL